MDELDLLRFSFELAGFPTAELPPPRIVDEVVILLLLRLVDEEAGLRRLPVDPKLFAATTRFPERGSVKKGELIIRFSLCSSRLLSAYISYP